MLTDPVVDVISIGVWSASTATHRREPSGENNPTWEVCVKA